MPLPPYNVYREQLTSLFHGHALWEPDPTNLYAQVSVGDVGYVREGCFFRMFNVLHEWNDPSNYTLCEPEPYTRLDLGPFVNIRESRFIRGEYYSRYVTPFQEPNTMAAGPDDFPGTAYSCRRKQGALLALPQDGLRKDVIRTKVFEDYIRDHVDSWYSFAMRRRLDVERMEDLILVTGCTLVTSWGVAAFVDSAQDSEVLLRFRGNAFDWREIRPSVACQNSHPNNLNQNQCVFIRGFRAKRVFLWTRLKGAAGPLPDDPDNRREDEIQVTRVPDVPSYRDPLIGVLDYLSEKCPDGTVAITHDDDLQQVEQVDTFTADAVASFLLQNEIGVLVENGAIILHDEEEEDIVPDERKAIFYAAAELAGELVPLVLHPVLAKYLLKVDITTQPVEHDFDLPTEEITSAASHPPMHSLKLESHQGYPQLITVQASSNSPSVGVTVQDVLRTIQEDVRMLSRRREWTKLSAEERAQVDTAFRDRCRTEEELGQGPCRVDYLRGRDRLQILPKLSPTGEMLPAPILPEDVFREALDESNDAGPSRIPIR